MRELRAKAADYLGGSEPIAVTRHGRVVGFYIPIPPDMGEVERTLQQLEQALGRLKAQTGLSEEALSDLFNLRKPLPTE
jgi:hypothetical protein